MNITVPDTTGGGQYGGGAIEKVGFKAIFLSIQALFLNQCAIRFFRFSKTATGQILDQTFAGIPLCGQIQLKDALGGIVAGRSLGFLHIVGTDIQAADGKGIIIIAHIGIHLRHGACLARQRGAVIGPDISIGFHLYHIDGFGHRFIGIQDEARTGQGPVAGTRVTGINQLIGFLKEGKVIIINRSGRVGGRFGIAASMENTYSSLAVAEASDFVTASGATVALKWR